MTSTNRAASAATRAGTERLGPVTNQRTDRYVTAVNTGWTASMAKRLGLPRPAVLRREAPGEPLTVGPVLIVADPTSATDSDMIAKHLLEWGLTVVRDCDKNTKLGAIVLVLTGIEDVSDMGGAATRVGSFLRRLAPNGRIVAVSRQAPDDASPELAAARYAIGGMLRSLAKELRAGATGNGLLLADEVPADAPSTLAALRFFLSPRSAYVDGQLLRIDAAGPELAQDFTWDRPLAGKVGVVTGAARGIGAAIARQLAADGAKLVLIDVPTAGEGLTRVANQTGAIALQLDITAPDAGDRIARFVAERAGKLDLLVHNAGITRDKLLANMTQDKWDAVIDVNVGAPLRINERLVAAKVLAAECRIVCLSSTSGIAGNRGQTNYGASKAAVIGMVRATGAILPPGAVINAVAPGFIETEMTARIPPIQREVFRRLNSLQQGGQPRDVAAAIAFLAAPGAGGIKGQVLRVCGQNIVGQ